MARINLGREQGVRVVGSAQHGATSPAGYEHLAGGYERLNRARESISRSVAYASDVFMKAFNDLAETRNRQEILEGRTKLFDITNQANTALEERINNGDFDNPNGLALFKEAVRASHVQVEKDFNEWSAQNVTQNSTRNALNEDARLDFKRNFAHLSGVFLAHDRRRRWDMFQNQVNDAVEMQNQPNLMAAYTAYFGDGSKENPYRFSEEVRERALKDALNRFDKKGLEIRFSQAEEIVNPDAQAAMYSSILADLESGKYKGLYSSELSKFVSGINKGLNGIELKNEINACSSALAKDLSEISQNQFDEWEKSAIAEIDAKKHLSNEQKNLFKEKISAKKKSLQARFEENARENYKNSTLSLLDAAVKSGNGDVDLSLDFVCGADLEKKRTEIDAKEGAFFGNGKNAQEYDGNFRNLMREIDNYKPGNDKDGMELRGLVFRTQGFLREHRIMLLNSLNKKAKGITPDKWSQENLEIFENQIDEMFDWYDVKVEREDEDAQIKENPKAVSFYQLKNSIVEDVKKLGLAPLEAQKYLQEHPIYKRLKDKQTYADAVDFLSGMANWKLPDISDSNGGADPDYNHPHSGSLRDVSDWRGRRYFGM